MKKYPVVTLCGSTRFKDEFERTQKELTLKGNIVISVGLFEHSGDTEAWEGKEEGTVTETKMMLDDMHKVKIDMADSIFVINPGGYIGRSTWSEICYARMTGKRIDSIEPIPDNKINLEALRHKLMAERLAYSQRDHFSHVSYDGSFEGYSYVEKDGYKTVDPWVPSDEDIRECHPKIDSMVYPGHAVSNSGYDPYKKFGKKQMARFIEEIIVRGGDTGKTAPSREELVQRLVNLRSLFGDQVWPDMMLDDMSDEDLKDWVGDWDEYDPYKNI